MSEIEIWLIFFEKYTTLHIFSWNQELNKKLYDLLLDFDSINNSSCCKDNKLIKFESCETSDVENFDFDLQTIPINIEELQKQLRIYLFYGSHINKISFQSIWVDNGNFKIKMGNF